MSERRTTRHWPDDRCLTCERGGYTPDTCPVWARHPLKDEADPEYSESARALGPNPDYGLPPRVDVVDSAPECQACPFPDQVAALELVRLREGIGRLASEYEAKADAIAITYQNPLGRTRATAPTRMLVARLRALLDDNQGER